MTDGGPGLQATVPVVLRFPLGALAGVVATLAMDAAMARLPEGATPPTVAAGVLTESHPDAAPRRLASAVHYLAGGLTGPLFVWLLLAGEALLGPGVVAAALSTLLLLALMVGFFVLVVLPRAGFPRERSRAVARDWAVSAAVYCAVLVPLVVAGSTLL